MKQCSTSLEWRCLKLEYLIDGITTVTGTGIRPKNLLLRIGTPMSDYKTMVGLMVARKIIMRGPMMGQAQAEQVPVINTSGILRKKVMWNIPSSHLYTMYSLCRCLSNPCY